MKKRTLDDYFIKIEADIMSLPKSFLSYLQSPSKNPYIHASKICLPFNIIRDLYTVLSLGLPDQDFQKALDLQEFLIKTLPRQAAEKSLVQLCNTYTIKKTKQLFEPQDINIENILVFETNPINNISYFIFKDKEADLVYKMMTKEWRPMTYLMIPSLLRRCEEKIRTASNDKQKELLIFLLKNFERF